MTLTLRPRTNAAKSVVRSDGLEVLVVPVLDLLGGLTVQYAARPAWYPPDVFEELAEFEYEGDPATMAQAILTDGGLWNTSAPDATGATWAELYAGGDYVSPTDGQTYSGTNAINRKFQDYLQGATTAGVEEATQHWLVNTYLPSIQAHLDATLAGLSPQPDPGPVPPVTTEFPPNLVNGVPTALQIGVTQFSRVVMSVDGSGRVVLSAGPVPA